ncbi:hypothetical protein D3C84_878620 [compost metagenome]
MACLGFLQFAADDEVAKQFGCAFRRKAVEVRDDFIQAPVELRFLASAVGVPQGVVHRIWRDIVANHVWYRLLEQNRSLAGLFRIELEDGGGFGRLAHARHCGKGRIGRD